MKLKLKLKNIISLALTCVLLLCLFGCGENAQENAQTEPEEADFVVYYLTKDNESIVPVPVELTAEDADGQVKELLAALSEDTGSVEYHKTIPSDVKLLDSRLDYNTLTLAFSEEYLRMDPITEVLCRAAIVETVTQVPAVMRVSFLVEDAPLTDSRGDMIGFMTADSFVQNPGRQINAIQETKLVLYFSNQDGDALLPETQEVHYSSNISMEKLVMERLLEDPLNSREKSAIPTGTQLLSVTVVDGVCYVNLDETFQNQDYSVQEPVVIYSIVDSLTELSGIQKVQISVNGDTNMVYRDKMSLTTLYERNMDLVEDPEEETEVEEAEQ
ncbi:MAG: GerMN domain-containing protein [Lachnospiraceae bacterium]|nr:GerMN domain-containing protein [Lachnospiraceae bacterium]